jgi:hypothetical protein
MNDSAKALDDIKVHVKFKLSALWASVMFCHIYGDYFGLDKPGTLQEMLSGNMGPLGPTTQGVLLRISVMMAVPGVMVFLSLVLKPPLNRWLNIVLGAIYTIIMLITMSGEWAFYIFFGVVEVILTMLVVCYAWKWPRRSAS